MSRMLRAVVPALVLVGALAGCGGDDEDPAPPGLTQDERTAADNLAAQIVRSGSVSGASADDDAVTKEQATCIAEGAVTDVGLDELRGYGILTEDLKVDKSIQGVQMEADDADALAAVFAECIDAEVLFEERFLSTVPPERTDEARRCLEELIDDDFVVTVLSSSFQGRATGDYERLQKQVTACIGDKDSGQ